MILFIHFTLLAIILWAIVSRISWPTLDDKCAAWALGCWTNILLTSFVLSAFSKFNSGVLFFILSIGLALLALVLFGSRKATENSSMDSSYFLVAKMLLARGSLFSRSAAVALTFVAFSALLLALLNPLQVPDAWSIKLPNAFFYIQHGNLIAPRQLWDNGRAFATPFSGALLWAYFLRWTDPTRPLLLANFMFGGLSCLGLYRFCRLCFLSEKLSFWLATLFSTSLVILFQMTTDNDDLLSAYPVFAGACFLLAWLREPQKKAYALMAALGLGIGFGAKNFPLLYAPFILLILAFFLVFKTQQIVDWLKRTSFGLCLFLFSFAGLTLPYYLSLYFEYGKFLLTPPLVGGQIMKEPGLLKTIHNLLIYILSALITPFVDLIQFQPYRTRARLEEFFNDTFLPFILPKIDGDVLWANAPAMLVEKYVYDHNVWYGFLGIAIIFSSIYVFFKKSPHRLLFATLSLLFWCWALVLSSRLLFIQGIARYWIMCFGLALPLVGYWLREKNERVLRGVLGFFVLTNLYFGICGLYANPIRYNLLNVLYPSPNDAAKELPSLREVAKNIAQVRIVNPNYGWPIFSIMRALPDRNFSIGTEIIESVFNIFPVYQRPVIDPIVEKTHIFVPFHKDFFTEAYFFDAKEQLRHADLFVYAKNCVGCEGLTRGALVEMNADMKDVVGSLNGNDAVRTIKIFCHLLKPIASELKLRVWLQESFDGGRHLPVVLSPDDGFEYQSFNLPFIGFELHDSKGTVWGSTIKRLVSEEFYRQSNL